MERRTARTNRIGLAIVGVVLLLAGLAALLLGLDLLPGGDGAPVLDEPVRDLAAQDWFWPVAAGVAVVVALLALWWLAIQTRTGALGTLRLEPDPSEGTTRLPAGTVADALEQDLAGSQSLSRPHARLVGSRVRPALRVSAAMDSGADPAAVRERVQDAIDRARQALEAPELPTTVRLRARS